MSTDLQPSVKFFMHYEQNFVEVGVYNVGAGRKIYLFVNVCHISSLPLFLLYYQYNPRGLTVPETSSDFDPSRAKFSFPVMDLQAEAIKPEQEIELQNIIEEHAEFVANAVNPDALAEFYEDIFHSDQTHYFVIDNFFTDEFGKAIVDDSTENIDKLRRQLEEFTSDLVDFANRRMGRSINVHQEFGPAYALLAEHVDGGNSTILANFDVQRDDLYYELRPFINEAVYYDAPTFEQARSRDENTRVFAAETVRVPIKSNQLVFLEASVPVINKMGGRARVTLPHGVDSANGNTGDPENPDASRMLLMVY